MNYSDFEILKVAYITNLFFTSTEDFKSATGKSWEYIFDHQKDSYILDSAIHRLNSLEMFQSLNITIRQFVISYLKVCEIWDNKKFWMELTTPRRRKEFAIYLLMHYIWPDFSEALDRQETSFLKNHRCYKTIEKKIFPGGYNEDPKIDPIMLALVLYKVIKPIELSSLETCRRHRLKPDIERIYLRNMTNLISDIKSRLPSPLDSIKASIDHSYNYYKNMLSSTIDAYQSSAIHWRLIYTLTIIDTQQSDSIKSNLSGIWEDDKKLYWIFPKTKNFQKGWITALRFEYKHPIKNAQIFAIHRTSFYNAVTNSTNWTFHELCGINPKRFCKGSFKEMIEEDTVSLSPVQSTDHLIEFNNIIPKRPLWCDWNYFKRLSTDNPYFNEILSITTSLTSRSVFEKLGDEFSNPDYWNDTLLALDKHYIYLFDQWTQSTPTIECDSDYNFSYSWIVKKQTQNLFSAEICKDKPVYIIPRRPSSPNLKPYMKDAIENADWDNPIMILHKTPDGIPCLYFPNYFITIPLDEKTMKLIGIRKITDPSDFFI